MSLLGSDVYFGLDVKEDPAYSETCLRMACLYTNALLTQRIIEYIMPNLIRDDINKIKNGEVASILIHDADLNLSLMKLNEDGQIQLEETLENVGFGFGVLLDLVRSKSPNGKEDCFWLEMQKFEILDDLMPDDKPDGDDDVEPHAEIEEERPITMAMAAGA